MVGQMATAADGTHPTGMHSCLGHVNKYSRSHSQSSRRCSVKQENIPVGCLSPACKPYMLQWQPPDVTLGRGDPQVNKFEQIQCWPPDVSRGLSPRSDVRGLAVNIVP